MRGFDYKRFDSSSGVWAGRKSRAASNLAGVAALLMLEPALLEDDPEDDAHHEDEGSNHREHRMLRLLSERPVG